MDNKPVQSEPVRPIDPSRSYVHPFYPSQPVPMVDECTAARAMADVVVSGIKATGRFFGLNLK